MQDVGSDVGAHFVECPIWKSWSKFVGSLENGWKKEKIGKRKEDEKELLSVKEPMTLYT